MLSSFLTTFARIVQAPTPYGLWLLFDFFFKQTKKKKKLLLFQQEGIVKKATAGRGQHKK